MLTVAAILLEYIQIDAELQKLRTEKKMLKKSLGDMVNRPAKERRMHSETAVQILNRAKVLSVCVALPDSW